MKKFITLLAYLAIVAWPTVGLATDEELLKLLKNKGSITQQEMDRLLEKAKDKEKKDTTLKAFYKDGFYLQTADKAFTLQTGGRVQADYRGLDSNNSDASSFVIRRARIFIAGTILENNDFKAEIDFGQGNNASMTDGYLNFKYLKPAQIMIGQFKEPFSLEDLTSSRFIDFVERSTMNALVPARDIGLMIHSEFMKGTVGYGLGIFNGNGSNRPRDNNNDKDVAGRFYFRPFAQTEDLWLKGLQVAVNFTAGEQTGSPVPDPIRTPVSRTPIIDWSGTVTHEDTRTRLGADLAWIVGPFSLKTEYVRMNLDNVRRGVQEKDFDIDGWYVTLGYFLTGEEKPYKRGAFDRIKVKNELNINKGGWGAWEMLARYDTLKADDDMINLGFASGTDKISTVTAGVNWYLNNMFAFKFNYVNNSFDDNLAALKGDDKENLFLARFQADF